MQPEDTIKDFLEKFTAEVRILPLTLKSNTDTCPVELSILMLYTEDIVGREGLTFVLVVVEELKVERKRIYLLYFQ